MINTRLWLVSSLLIGFSFSISAMEPKVTGKKTDQELHNEIVNGIKEHGPKLALTHENIIGYIDLSKEPILYTKAQDNIYHIFDNLPYSPFIYEGTLYFSVEEAFQSAKVIGVYGMKDSWDTVAQDRRLKKSKDLQDPQKMAKYSALCKKAGQLNVSQELKKKWQEVSLETMNNIVLAKFLQNPAEGKLLVDTLDCLIYEKSFQDAFYASGPDGNGSNFSGIAVMRARKFIRENPSAVARPAELDQLLAQHDAAAELNIQEAKFNIQEEARLAKEKKDKEAEEARKKALEIRIKAAHQSLLNQHCKSNSLLGETKKTLKGASADLAMLEARLSATISLPGAEPEEAKSATKPTVKTAAKKASAASSVAPLAAQDIDSAKQNIQELKDKVAILQKEITDFEGLVMLEKADLDADLIKDERLKAEATIAQEDEVKAEADKAKAEKAAADKLAKAEIAAEKAKAAKEAAAAKASSGAGKNKNSKPEVQ